MEPDASPSSLQVHHSAWSSWRNQLSHSLEHRKNLFSNQKTVWTIQGTFGDKDRSNLCSALDTLVGYLPCPLDNSHLRTNLWCVPQTLQHTVPVLDLEERHRTRREPTVTQVKANLLVVPIPRRIFRRQQGSPLPPHYFCALQNFDSRLDQHFLQATKVLLYLREARVSGVVQARQINQSPVNFNRRLSARAF